MGQPWPSSIMDLFPRDGRYNKHAARLAAAWQRRARSGTPAAAWWPT